MANLRTNNLSGEQGQNAYRGSVFFDGSTGYLDIASNSDFAYGTGDFTWEAWVLLARGQATGYIFDHGSDGGTLQYESNNVRYYNSTTGNSGALYDDGGSIDYDGWHHLAVARSSGTTKLFVNGIQKASASDSHNYSAQAVTIGDYGANTGTNKWRGYISNARITKGEALYTADFTPPTTELTADANTVLLCCQDSDDVTQEATGKTITGNGSLATAGYNKTQPKVIPPYGVDAGNVFGGPIQQSTQGYMCFPTGRTEERGRGRGLHAGGEAPSHSNIIDYIQIQSGGTAIDFGDLITLCNSCDGVSSNTRAVFCTFDSPSFNLMEFVTISTTGNGTDFGDQTVATGQEGTLSNQTRGLFAGGYRLIFYSTVEFITIANIGNGTDFGDLREAIVGVGGAADTTRGLFAGGVVPGAYRNSIDQFTIATTGNATDFGDLTVARRNPAGTSDSTRGVFFGGNDSGGTNVIDFVTIQSAGNATDFGDSTSNQADASGSSDSIRGVFSAGYYGAPALTNVIEKVIIQTTGNSVDYGDLSVSRIQGGSVSDSHGGLS